MVDGKVYSRVRNSTGSGTTLRLTLRDHPSTNAQGPFRNQESGIRNQESGIRNQESEIRNQESEIRNPKSFASFVIFAFI
jgi:hypothetical protein